MTRALTVALLASIGLGAGCLTTDAPSEFVARRHACTALENQTFTSANVGILALAAGDEDFSTYEWTHGDGSVTNGLLQCETRDATTLIYADAAELATGRVTSAAPTDAAQMIWFGEVASPAN
jgi:hypothetical protein